MYLFYILRFADCLALLPPRVEPNINPAYKETLNLSACADTSTDTKRNPPKVMCQVMDNRRPVFLKVLPPNVVVIFEYVAVISDKYVAVIFNKYVAVISNKYVAVICNKYVAVISNKYMAVISDMCTRL